MPSFEGRKRIVLQPNDSGVPYRFEFPIASAVDANDGAIPHGDSISSVVATAYDAAGSDVSSQIAGTPTTGAAYVVVPLSYPTTSGEGSYKLTMVITTVNGINLEFDYDRIRAVDL